MQSFPFAMTSGTTTIVGNLAHAHDGDGIASIGASD